MSLIEQSNWLSFNIYLPPNTLLNDIPERNQCYFEFLRDSLTPFLESRGDQIDYLFFSHYIDQRPRDTIKIDHFNINNWNQKLQELPEPLKIQLGNNLSYIRLRLFIKDDIESIERDFAEILDNLEIILGYESVEYNVLVDLGDRFSNHSNSLSQSIMLKRLKYFIEYWNSICMYILSIISDTYILDFENVDVTGILHLGFNSLGNYLPLDFQLCEECGAPIYFLANKGVICRFKCDCGYSQGRLPFL